MKLEFDEASHTYKLDGAEIPGVTRTLPYPVYYNSENARQVGQYVHQMVYLYNIGELDEERLDPLLVPYLSEYKRFRSENPGLRGLVDIKTGQPDPATGLQLAAYELLAEEGIAMDGRPMNSIETAYEIAAYHPLYRYAGTIDILERNNDIVRSEYTGITERRLHLGTLYLRSDTHYRFVDYSRAYPKIFERQRNREYFLAFLATYQWKKEHKRDKSSSLD